MKQALIVPQFGLAAKRFAEDADHSPQLPPLQPPLQASLQPAASRAVVAYSGSSTFRPTSGPNVVVKTVKRRRLELAPGATGAGAVPQDISAGEVTAEPGADSSKSPKVFLLAPASPAPLERGLDGAQQPDEPPLKVNGAEVPPDSQSSVSTSAASEPVATTTTVAPRKRRRRDPITAPVLVRHVVFERPAAATATEVPAPALQNSSTSEEPTQEEPSYATVCQALQELSAKINAAERVRELLDGIVLPGAKKGLES